MDVLKELWVLRYKAGVKGAESGFIQASDEATAMEVGFIYCQKRPGYRFIAVEKPILADESILEKAAEEAKEFNVAEMGVVDVMSAVKQGKLDADTALQAEKNGQSRKSLIDYLNQKLGNQPELPDGFKEQAQV